MAGASLRLRRWLWASGSLTRQLSLQAAGQFRVQLVAQHDRGMKLQEQQALGLGRPQRVRVREVLLYGRDPEPWVYARTLIPERTLCGEGRQMRHLGGRALGYYLFARGRQPQALRWVEHQLGRGWQRSTRYRLRTGVVLVSELFLPAFLARLDQQDFEP